MLILDIQFSIIYFKCRYSSKIGSHDYNTQQKIVCKCKEHPKVLVISQSVVTVHITLQCREVPLFQRTALLCDA